MKKFKVRSTSEPMTDDEGHFRLPQAQVQILPAASEQEAADKVEQDTGRTVLSIQMVINNEES